jgi:hypothetical protein
MRGELSPPSGQLDRRLIWALVNIALARISCQLSRRNRAPRAVGIRSPGLPESSAQLLLPSFAFRIRDEYSASRGLGHDQLAFERDLHVDWNVGSVRNNAGKNRRQESTR